MGEIFSYFKKKKNLINLLVLGILILGIPLGVSLVRLQQIIKSRASVDPIVFIGSNVRLKSDGTWVATKPQIQLQLTSPLGLPAGAQQSSTRTVQSKDSLVNSLSEILVGTIYAAVDPGTGVGGCGAPQFKYNQCVACNTSQPVYQDACGNYTTGSNQSDSGCASWCTTTPAAPPPAASQVCTPGSYEKNCNQNRCGGCNPDQGIQSFRQCNSSGTGWGNWQEQCSVECAGPCKSTSTTSPKPATSTPTGSAGTYTGTGWYGCSDWVSDNCPDKTKTCTIDGKAGVECNITCTACGSKANGQAFMSGACGGPTTSNPYCDPAGSGNMIGGTCTWKVCTPGNTTGATGPCNVTATLSSACTNCVLKVKNAGGGDLYNTIKGFDHQRFDACSFEQVTSYWCTGLSAGATAECNSIKAGACVSACTGSGSAPVPSSGGGGPAPSGSGGATSSPAPTPAAFTTKFRIAEQLADLNSAPWQDYTATVASTPFDYTFKDTKPGQKFIFVQFMDSAGKVTTTADCPKCQAQIKLLGPDPTMKSCSLSFEGSNAILNLTGQNFGSDKKTIKSGDSDLQIRSWKDDSIQAVLQNAPTGQVLPVNFTNTDEQTGTGQCSSISQLSLGAKVFCRAPASHDTENVEIVLVDETGKKMRQTVRIDKNGVVQGLTQRLEDGKRYMLSLKAPKSLRRNVPFTAGGGTVSIPNFVLPVGEIFPLDGGDGVINALDKAELNREWNISGDATGRLGDFNQDGKINSIDWACMRFDFGQSDDPEPTVPPPPASSANSSASASPR